ATRQPIQEMKLPTVEAVNDQRIAKFMQRISDSLATGELTLFQQLIEQYEQEHDVPAIEIAAALARIAQGDRPLLLAPPPKREAGRSAASVPNITASPSANTRARRPATRRVRTTPRRARSPTASRSATTTA